MATVDPARTAAARAAMGGGSYGDPTIDPIETVDPNDPYAVVPPPPPMAEPPMSTPTPAPVQAAPLPDPARAVPALRKVLGSQYGDPTIEPITTNAPAPPPVRNPTSFRRTSPEEEMQTANEDARVPQSTKDSLLKRSGSRPTGNTSGQPSASAGKASSGAFYDDPSTAPTSFSTRSLSPSAQAEQPRESGEDREMSDEEIARIAHPMFRIQALRNRHLIRAAKHRRGGENAMADAEATMAEEYGRTIESYDTQNSAHEREMQRRRDEVTRLNSQASAESEDLKKMELDNRSYFERNPVSAVLGVIGAALGGALSGRTGQPNSALNALENAIERDVSNQKYAIDKKRKDIDLTNNLVARARQAVGDEQSANLLAKKNLAELAAMRFQKIMTEGTSAERKQFAAEGYENAMALIHGYDQQLYGAMTAAASRPGGGLPGGKANQINPGTYHATADGFILDDKQGEAYEKSFTALSGLEHNLERAYAARKKFTQPGGKSLAWARMKDKSGLQTDPDWLELQSASEETTVNFAKAPETFTGVLGQGEVGRYQVLAGRATDLNVFGSVDKNGDDEIGRQLLSRLQDVRSKKQSLPSKFGTIPGRNAIVGEPGGQRVIPIVTGPQGPSERAVPTVTPRRVQ